MYDIGGGVFDDLDLLTEKGKYLAHSDTIFFIVSLVDPDVLEDWNLKIMALLDRYIHVVYSRFGIELAKNQNLFFVFTKSDELAKRDDNYKLSDELIEYLNSGSFKNMNFINDFTFNKIKYDSDMIKEWLRTKGCNSFINLAENHFKTVNFALVSALGDAPVNNVMVNSISPESPKRVLEPVFWALNATKLKTKKKSWFFF